MPPLHSPYATLVSVNKATCALAVVKTISLPFATNGAEQYEIGVIGSATDH
jgi:hypothetical protein